MTPATALGLLAEDHEDILEAAAREPAARDLGADAAFTTRGIRKIDEIILGKTRMERDIHQPALAVDGDLGQAGNGLKIAPAGPPDDAEPPRPFGDEHPAVGQEGEAPRVLETLDYLHDAKGMLLGRDGVRACRQRDQGA